MCSFCLNKVDGWRAKPGILPLLLPQFISSGGTVQYILCIHVACCHIFIFMTQHLAGTLHNPLLYLIQSEKHMTFCGNVSFHTVKSTTNQILILSVTVSLELVFVRPCVMAHIHALYLFLLSAWIIIIKWACSCNRKMSTEVLLGCSSTLTLSTHLSVCCWGYTALRVSWPFRLCSADGPVVSSSVLLILSASVELLSCAAARQPCSYANTNSWLVSSHMQVLHPHGASHHLQIFRLQQPFVCTVSVH